MLSAASVAGLMRLLLLAALLQASAQPPPGAELVSFPSGNLTLRGFLYKPAGAGPFPAMLWNHGSEKMPGWRPELADFYTRNGFVFFLPHRRGHGRSPGEYIGDLQQSVRSGAHDRAVAERRDIELHEIYNQDVVAALGWLKTQRFVDPGRIVMSGVSYGGIQTLLSAEKGLELRACVPFAPGAMSWSNPLLGKRLGQAVAAAPMPLFLIQAQNDYSLGPSEWLAPQIERKKGLNRAKLYPAFGTSPQDGHAGFATNSAGIAVWGPDVLAFLKAALESLPLRS